MPEILAFGTVLVAFLVAFLWFVKGILGTGNGDRQARTINGNHHGLYLLVNDLVSAQDRGWTTVFPDQATLDKARGLLSDYEDQITALGVGLGQQRPSANEGIGLPRWTYTENGPEAGPDLDG